MDARENTKFYIAPSTAGAHPSYYANWDGRGSAGTYSSFRTNHPDVAAASSSAVTIQVDGKNSPPAAYFFKLGLRLAMVKSDLLTSVARLSIYRRTLT